MLTSLNESKTARVASAKSMATLLTVTLSMVALSTTNGFANQKPRRPVVVVRPAHVVPISPYAPYYYSAWNPYSIYSIYDHLSGGRQSCTLPSEPCDNTHRVQN